MPRTGNNDQVFGDGSYMYIRGDQSALLYLPANTDLITLTKWMRVPRARI